jgi:hypothetical protein
MGEGGAAHLASEVAAGALLRAVRALGSASSVFGCTSCRRGSDRVPESGVSKKPIGRLSKLPSERKWRYFALDLSGIHTSVKVLGCSIERHE